MSKTPAPDTVKYAVLEALTNQPPGRLESPKDSIIEYLQRYVAIPNTTHQRHRIHQVLATLAKEGTLARNGIQFIPGTNPSQTGHAPQRMQVIVTSAAKPLAHGKWRGTVMGQGKPKKKNTPTKYENMPTNDGIPLRQVGLDLLDSTIEMIRYMGDSPQNHVLLSSLEMVRYIAAQEADFHDRYEAWVGSGTGRKIPDHI